MNTLILDLFVLEMKIEPEDSTQYGFLLSSEIDLSLRGCQTKHDNAELQKISLEIL